MEEEIFGHCDQQVPIQCLQLVSVVVLKDYLLETAQTSECSDDGTTLSTDEKKIPKFLEK